MKHLKSLGILCLVLLFINCGNKESNKKEIALAKTEIKEAKIDLINNEFPEAKKK